MLIDGVIDAEIIARQLGLSLDQLALAAAQLEARGCVKAAPDRCMRRERLCEEGHSRVKGFRWLRRVEQLAHTDAEAIKEL